MNIVLGLVLSVLFFEAKAILVETYADLGCLNGGTQLKHLAYVRIVPRTKTQDASCSSVIVNGFTDTYTFYYYDDPYVSGESCRNIKSVNASVTFGTVLNTRELGSTIGLDVNGTFSSGPYAGLQVVTTLTYLTANLNQCNTEVGMELLTGNIVIAVIGGPICNGVAVKKYCPGIKYGNGQNVGITLPELPVVGQLLPKITIPIPILG
ncbi:uncharacterized protein LOC119070383 [Bradysia coprophila]|uniref:uncharacterized protein LOC119070383 n=1 Tax=Bradysia coprophila TaxID=38358 RepID=UPI00187D9565|nr:uncharacterized protein LOC119070383 [Bradysia coprophila]